MKREEIIFALKKYFSIGDLVCRDTLKAHGEGAWKFFRTEFLLTLLIIRRDILKVPMTCNNPQDGLTQRGLRCNLCQIVSDKTKKSQLYLSAHNLGCAGDFSVTGLTSEQARKVIIDNRTLLPCPIRMEEGVSWLHFDTYDEGQEYYKFFKQ